MDRTLSKWMANLSLETGVLLVLFPLVNQWFSCMSVWRSFRLLVRSLPGEILNALKASKRALFLRCKSSLYSAGHIKDRRSKTISLNPCRYVHARTHTDANSGWQMHTEVHKNTCRCTDTWTHIYIHQNITHMQYANTHPNSSRLYWNGNRWAVVCVPMLAL